MKALLLENIHPKATRGLQDAGFEVDQIPGALGEDELIEALQGVQMVGIRSRTQITEKVVKNCPDLIVVGAFCIGTNQIDLDATAAAGIPVFNAPYSNTRSVVELAIGEIISLARRLPEKNQNMHQGIWKKTATGSHEIRGRTLGIVGYGSIGSQLSVLAEAMGMHVYFYDLLDKLAIGNAVQCSSLEELLGKVETVSLHVDGRPENNGFFGEAQFDMMRERALFLNLARGKVVDIAALAKNLKSGKIAGAALDTYPVEPRSSNDPNDPFVSELRGIPNVILTPHVGGSTQEAQVDIGGSVSSKLSSFIYEGTTESSVNFPEIHLTRHPGSTRILDVHNNVPGALASLNQVFASRNVNIVSQTLSTRGSMGYVITDITGDTEGIDDQIQALSETVRVRKIELK